jgi:hypothetical protein
MLEAVRSWVGFHTAAVHKAAGGVVHTVVRHNSAVSEAVRTAAGRMAVAVAVEDMVIDFVDVLGEEVVACCIPTAMAGRGRMSGMKVS